MSIVVSSLVLNFNNQSQDVLYSLPSISPGLAAIKRHSDKIYFAHAIDNVDMQR